MLFRSYSNRSGRYEIWRIQPDGGGLQQLTRTPGGQALYPVWSPDETRLAYTSSPGPVSILRLGAPGNEEPPRPLPLYGDPALEFRAWSWSPDGRKLGGWLLRSGTTDAGIVIYSLESQKFQRVTDFGRQPVWLNDNRRLLFGSVGGLYVADRVSRKVRQILSIAPQEIGGLALSPDNRTIYYNSAVTDGDIWLAERP